MNLHSVILGAMLISVLLLITGFLEKKLKAEVLKTVVINLRNLAVALISLELIFSILIYFYYPAAKARPDYANFEVVQDPKSFFDESDLLSYTPRANTSVTLSTSYQGEVLKSNLIYEIDSLNRRTFNGNHGVGNDKYAVFFGDSFMFGVYVEGDSTLSARFQAMNEGYTSYNYGVGGYGPQMMFLQAKDLLAENAMLEEDGIFIYLLTGDGHLDRLYGTFRTDFLWYEDHPWLGEEGGKIVSKGKIRDKPAYPFLRLLRKLNVVKFFNIKIPYKFTDKHIQFFSQVFNETHNILKEKFGDKRFIIVNYPTVTIDYESYLNDGIEVLDLSHLQELFMTDETLKIPGDGHPSAKAYDIIAKELTNYINK